MEVLLAKQIPTLLKTSMSWGRVRQRSPMKVPLQAVLQRAFHSLSDNWQLLSFTRICWGRKISNVRILTGISQEYCVLNNCPEFLTCIRTYTQYKSRAFHVCVITICDVDHRYLRYTYVRCYCIILNLTDTFLICLIQSWSVTISSSLCGDMRNSTASWRFLSIVRSHNGRKNHSLEKVQPPEAVHVDEFIILTM